MTARQKGKEFISWLCWHIEHVIEEVSPVCGKKGKGGPPEDEPHIKGKAVV